MISNTDSMPFIYVKRNILVKAYNNHALTTRDTKEKDFAAGMNVDRRQ